LGKKKENVKIQTFLSMQQLNLSKGLNWRSVTQLRPSAVSVNSMWETLDLHLALSGHKRAVGKSNYVKTVIPV